MSLTTPLNMIASNAFTANSGWNARPGQVAVVQKFMTALEMLRHCDAFSGLSASTLSALAGAMRAKVFGQGQLIVREADKTADHIFFVAEGEAAAFRDTEGDKEMALASFRPGDFFGEMALLNGEMRSASVRAMTQTKVYSLHRDDFKRCLMACPEVAWSLLGELANRLRIGNTRMGSLAHQKVNQRIALTLEGLMENKGVRMRDDAGKRVVFIAQRPTQQLIAEMAGTSRESVSRAFSAWEKEGWLKMTGRDLWVLNEGRLATAH